MLKTLAVLFGVVLAAAGILGFMPQFTPGNHLFGWFQVDFLHNCIHLATGVIAIICGFSSECSARCFFRAFGVIYAIVAGLGFYYGDAPILGVLANNMADTWLHVIIAVIFLFLGFSCCCRSKSCSS